MRGKDPFQGKKVFNQEEGVKESNTWFKRKGWVEAHSKDLPACRRQGDPLVLSGRG